jgi:hypothetical protein
MLKTIIQKPDFVDSHSVKRRKNGAKGKKGGLGGVARRYWEVAVGHFQ